MSERDLAPWERQQHEDTRKLAEEVRRAGPDGLTRQQLAELARLRKDRFDAALRLLADANEITRSEEMRLDRRGHERTHVVFRHAEADPLGSVPARVSRDPAVRKTLDDLGLIEAVAQAKVAGLRNPHPIARWIIRHSHPLERSRIFDWVDVEGLLAGRIEELEREAS